MAESGKGIFGSIVTGLFGVAAVVAAKAAIFMPRTLGDVVEVAARSADDVTPPSGSLKGAITRRTATDDFSYNAHTDLNAPEEQIVVSFEVFSRRFAEAAGDISTDLVQDYVTHCLGSSPSEICLQEENDGEEPEGQPPT